MTPDAARRLRATLRLRAEDAEDLAVISACLQDALVAVRDLAYDPEARKSSCWSPTASAGKTAGPTSGDGGPFERTLCGVTFDEVDGRGLSRLPAAARKIASCRLLAIRWRRTTRGPRRG